jgi:saccharopine dehydrogenase-like NADP-dependent oxidoreductase
MKKILAIFGAGKIGDALVALILASGKYNVTCFDHSSSAITKIKDKWSEKFKNNGLEFNATVADIDNQSEVENLIKGSLAVISALPFFCNIKLATYCLNAGCHYFDLTEDVATTASIKAIAAKSSKQLIFMPQCGLAPGFISIAANSLANDFDKVDEIKMRVGALPLFPSNRLKYNLTWSTDGLINEYGNPCEILVNGKKELVRALEGEERFSLDGIEYEAFNTSGGLGTLCETLQDKVKNLSYKSIRYPGHLEYIRFLMHDLNFNEYRNELKAIFERAIPTTKQDKCITYVEVKGLINGTLHQKTFAETVYDGIVSGEHLGAIQITTSAGILAPIDLLLSDPSNPKSKGFSVIEQINLKEFLANEFGSYYAS